MNTLRSLLFVVCAFAFSFAYADGKEPAAYVHPMMGTGAEGRVSPIAAAPFGMVQLAPDNFYTGSGYHYSFSFIQGFSHTHASGNGGADYQDILFFPISDASWMKTNLCQDRVGSHFTHDKEHVEPGYYQVKLLDPNINVELTATSRCGMHRYSYPSGANREVLIDLKHASEHSCTIWPDEDYDTVKISRLEVVDSRTVRGYRVSNGWAPEQHVYFYVQFSEPFAAFRMFHQRKACDNVTVLQGRDERVILDFGTKDAPIIAKIGISPVSMEGAEKNLKAEIHGYNFDKVRRQTYNLWNKYLSAIKVDDVDSPQKDVFYTSLYFAMLYPQLYSDVNGDYRSSDSKVYHGNFRYFAGVLGLWDTFRTQDPLMGILHPDVINDLMRTFLEHYRHCGQLPLWTLAGVENQCMIGYHSMPIIADAYAKGIRNYDAEALFNAMKASSNRDTFGYFLKDFRGARYYTKYHYVPCEKEMFSVSKTLEYCYDDWCIAQMAKMLGHQKDYNDYIERAGWYKNVYDSSSTFMRGRFSDGKWRTPFDPIGGVGYTKETDFCEGDSWQYTFFVPHDGKGLMNLMGGKQKYVMKLDSLFSFVSPNAPKGMGFIGQYWHGNETDHQAVYMYNYVGQPWKTQKLVSDVLYTCYNTSPEGMCGNDDTGQMSSWFVMGAMGFYPVTHGTAIYFIGSPIFKEVQLKHHKGVLTIKAENVSRENCYIQSLTLDGKPYTKNWIRYADLFSKNATLVFQMGNKPNESWGSSMSDTPPSMCDETFAGK